jgi:hypothetical protein
MAVPGNLAPYELASPGSTLPQGSVALRPTQGVLKTQPRLGSDGHGQLVERNRHTPIRRLLNGQLVVSAPNVLDERMAGDDDSGATVLLSPRIGRRRAFSRP